MDVLVIGGGFAGLTAAALLARRGLSVELIERSRWLGGRARSIRRNGWIVDYGIHGHRCGEQGAAARALRLVGKRIEWVKESADDSLLISDGQARPQLRGIGPFLKSRDYSAGQKLALAWLFARLLRLDPRRNKDRDAAGLLGPGADAPVRDLLRFLSFGMIAPELERSSRGELACFVKQMLATPVDQRLGTPINGAAQVIDKLRLALLEAGGRISLAEPLRGIALERGRVVRAVTAKRELQPRAVLFTAPLQTLHKYVDATALGAGFVERCRGIEPTAGLSLDLGLSRRVSDLQGTVIDLDLPSFVKFPSNSDPSLAPPDKQLATLLIVIPAQRACDRPTLAAAEQRLREHARQRFPGLYAAIEWERRMVLPILDGALLRPGQSRWDRPGLQAPGADNLFLAGDSTCGAGCSGDIAFDSAVNAAELIAQRLHR